MGARCGVTGTSWGPHPAGSARTTSPLLDMCTVRTVLRSDNSNQAVKAVFVYYTAEPMITLSGFDISDKSYAVVTVMST